MRKNRVVTDKKDDNGKIIFERTPTGANIIVSQYGKETTVFSKKPNEDWGDFENRITPWLNNVTYQGKPRDVILSQLY